MRGKIGIRPINDGRDSVRYKTEEKTFKMAEECKKLIEENVFYLDGTPVEVVIGKHSITCAAEAVDIDEEFEKMGVTATISVSPIFSYGSETMDMNPHTIKAIWGFNGTERPGAVYLACTNAAYAERGLPVFSIFGKDVQDLDDDRIQEDVKEKILIFAKASTAVGEMKNRSYISIGGVSMGIAGSYLEPLFLQNYLGMRAEWIDMNEVNRRIVKKIYDEKEYQKAAIWVKDNINVGEDVYNSKELQHTEEQYKKDWEYSIKMAIVIRDIMNGNPYLKELGYYEESLGKKAIVGGFQGQRQWTDYLPNCDFAESILNSSFDWNGIRHPYPFATENDTLNGITMLFGTLLTNKATIFADVRTYWSPEAIYRVTGKKLNGVGKNGFIHLNNSGAATLDGAGEMKENEKSVMKEWWKITDEDVKNTLKATTYYPANLEYFKAGGFSGHYVTRAEMPATMMRINRINNLGPVIQVVEGYTVNVDKEISDVIEERTDKAWPTTFFAPTENGSNIDAHALMDNWGANHCALAYGHIGKEVLALASMLRIPVSMHNVPKSEIFRPHVWKAFGMDDSVSSDILACKNFGPLYK